MCLTAQSGDSAEPREEGREKPREAEPIRLEERRTDLLQGGRSEREICSTKEKTPVRGGTPARPVTSGMPPPPSRKALCLSAGRKPKDFC